MKRPWRCAATLPGPPLALLALLAAAGCSDAGDPGGDTLSGGGTVVVYTQRDGPAERELFRRFQDRTQVQVTPVHDPDPVGRLRREGRDSPADLVVVTDAVRLDAAGRDGLLRPLRDHVLQAAVPEALRGEESRWYGLAQEVPVVAWSCGALPPDSVPGGLEALAEERWRGRLAVSGGGELLSLLVAVRMVRDGEEAARAWTEAVVENAGLRPGAEGREGAPATPLQALRGGDAALALVGSVEAAADTAGGLCFRYPDQDRPGSPGRGAPVKLAAAAVPASAPAPAAGRRLLRFLLSREAQTLLAREALDHPVRDDVPWAPVHLARGALQADTLEPAALVGVRERAAALLEEARLRPAAGPEEGEAPAPPASPPPPGTAPPPGG